MLRVHAFVLTLGRCGFYDAVDQFLQGVVLVSGRDDIVGCGHLPYESNRVVDIPHHMLQDAKMMGAASSNGPLLLGHDAHSEAPCLKVSASKQYIYLGAALADLVQGHQHHVEEVLEGSVELCSPCVA